VYRAAIAEDAVVYHFHDPELIPIALLLKLHGKRVIYDVHEDMPQLLLTKPWIPRPFRWLIASIAGTIEVVSAAFWDGIAVATPTIGRRFPAHKTVLVQNFPRRGEFALGQANSYADRPVVVAYVGGISAIRGAREMIQMMSILPASLNARLSLAGPVRSTKLDRELRIIPGSERVAFLGWQSREEVARLLGQSRVGLVVLHPTRNYVDAQPTKLFEYMSAGIPVVASNFPIWKSIIQEANCGLAVNPLDPHAIAGAVQWVLEHPQEAEEMGRRGQKAVRDTFNWESQAETLLRLYRRVLDCPS
jgi:glycosyltransferase involved in cell wall biosynthesis